MEKIKYLRLESLDILRGLDLFILVGFQSVFMYFVKAIDDDSFVRSVFNVLFTHVEWEGFHLWDQIMPLFLFMTGTSIPYAMSKYKCGNEKVSRKIMFRVLKRVILLWIFGAIVQGNLLDFNINTLYLYTDTLQSIAMGYLFSVILFLFLNTKALLCMFFILPSVYTIGMLFTGGYCPGENLAELIDRLVLGQFLYGATVSQSGEVVFADWYHISWIYSTLNFTTTVLSGVLIGILLKSSLSDKDKLRLLFLAAISSFILYFLFNLVEPVIKRLWTSSMTFLSSGFSILLMLLSYYWIDIKKQGKKLKWLKIYGMNSILAYMLFHTLDINSLLKYWLHGFEQILGSFYPMLLELVRVSIIFYILLLLYRKNIFLKV